MRKYKVCEDDIRFVMELIKNSRIDENLWITPFDIDTMLTRRSAKLCEIFHKVSMENGIKWNHTNKDDEKDLKILNL